MEAIAVWAGGERAGRHGTRLRIGVNNILRLEIVVGLKEPVWESRIPTRPPQHTHGQSCLLPNLDETSVYWYFTFLSGWGGGGKSCHLWPFGIWSAQVGHFIPREEKG